MGGADVAVEAAGVTLMRSDPRLVAAAIDIARRTVRKIRQNLFWAFIYNVVLIPIAAGIFIPLFGSNAILNPIYAAVAMALSSITVTLNSMLLNHWKPRA